MINLKNASSILRAITAAVANVTCRASWVDPAGFVVSADSAILAPITTVTTATLVPRPAAATVRMALALALSVEPAPVSVAEVIQAMEGA